MLEEQIRSIAETGVNAIIAGGAVSDMAMHFAEKYKILVVKITSKWELRRMCRAAGAGGGGHVRLHRRARSGHAEGNRLLERQPRRDGRRYHRAALVDGQPAQRPGARHR